MKNNETLNTIFSRRSIRHFTDKEIDDGTLKTIIKAATYAPSAWDKQTWKFFIVKDTQKRNSIYESVLQVMREKNPDLNEEEEREYLGIDAPIQIFVCNDINGIEDKRVQHECAVSCVAATQNLIIAAQSLGLRTCWQGDPLLAKDEIIKQLKIQPGVELVTSVALGYPASEPCSEKIIKDFDITVCYDEFSTSREIR